MPQVPVFCGRDCGGDACPLLATVEDGRVTRVTNNPAGGRYFKGCQRGFELPVQMYAPERLLTPLLRDGERGSGHFRPASWDEALDVIAGRLLEVRSRHGAQAVMNLGSAGATGALHGTPTLLSRFLHTFGGCTHLTNNYSNGAARFILPYLLGEDWKRAGWDGATLQHSQMILLWGANVLDTRMGAEVPARLMEARQRGVPVVVIDPRRTLTVERAATWWLPIRPGTDAALMLALLHVLFSENLAQRQFAAERSVGFDELERYVLGLDGGEARTPAWAQPITGIPAEETVRLARAYAAAKPAMLFPGYSIQRVFAGEESYRLSVALQLATGNFGVRGGSTGSLNNRLGTPRAGSLPVPPLPGLPEVPIGRWPDAILEGRAGGYPSDIHAIYSLGGNFINQGADVHKNIRAFQKADFTVCHEMFLTPTARWCDVVLPAAAPLEKEDLATPWLGNFLLYKPQAVPPAGQARSDYDILCDLAQRMGFGEQFSEGRSAAQWVELFIRQSEVEDSEALRRTGIYFGKDLARVGLEDFSADPQAHPLDTPSGRVEIASRRYHQETGFPAIPTWQAPPQDGRFPLRLLTPKSRHFTHSQCTQLAAMQGKAERCLSMHPQDAAARGADDGDEVLVFNENGRARLRLSLTDGILPGVVSIPEGLWLELDETGVERGGSANVFTSSLGTAPGKACIMHAVGVQVEKIQAA